MTHMTRRRFLGYGAGVSAALALPLSTGTRVSAASAGGKLTKYMEPLPVPGAGIVVATDSGPDAYSFSQTQIARRLHPQLPKTPLWAYDDGSGLDCLSDSFGMAVVEHSSLDHDLPSNEQLRAI